MSRTLKLILKCTQNPKNVRFNEIVKLLVLMDFKLVNVHGSHYHFDNGKALVTIVKPTETKSLSILLM